MTALDYPIGDKYGDEGFPYSAAHPHKGNDYKAPEGTPLIVAGVQVGLSGHTGSYLGQGYAPHLHVQAGRDIDAQQSVEPTQYTNQPGAVVQAEFRDEWGNFVNIRAGDMYVHYCHLSRIDVKVGQKIGEDMPYTDQQYNDLKADRDKFAEDWARQYYVLGGADPAKISQTDRRARLGLTFEQANADLNRDFPIPTNNSPFELKQQIGTPAVPITDLETLINEHK